MRMVVATKVGKERKVYLTAYNKQEAQSHCDIFRQGGTKMIDWTYNTILKKKRIFERKELAMEILMEEFKPM